MFFDKASDQLFRHNIQRCLNRDYIHGLVVIGVMNPDERADLYNATDAEQSLA